MKCYTKKEQNNCIFKMYYHFYKYKKILPQNLERPTITNKMNYSCEPSGYLIFPIYVVFEPLPEKETNYSMKCQLLRVLVTDYYNIHLLLTEAGTVSVCA